MPRCATLRQGLLCFRTTACLILCIMSRVKLFGPCVHIACLLVFQDLRSGYSSEALMLTNRYFVF